MSIAIKNEETLITRISIQLGKIHRELQGHTHWSTYLDVHKREFHPELRLNTLIVASDDLQQAALDIELIDDNEARETLEQWHGIIIGMFSELWEQHEQLIRQSVS